MSDDPRDDLEPGGRDTRNDATIGIIGVIVTVLAVVAIVALVRGATEAPPAPRMCKTSCVGFVKLECPGNRVMGGCFGVWICSEPLHRCGTNP